jgi:nicotinate-nucleotide pyrophosphorylase (carboxylating)
VDACSIPNEVQAKAKFLAKEEGILAGAAVVDAVFMACSRSIYGVWHKGDGAKVAKGEEFATFSGDARAIMRAERVALNFMQVGCHQPVG